LIASIDFYALSAPTSLSPRFKSYQILIAVALYSFVWLDLFHPLGGTWNSTRLTRNTIVRDQLGHFSWES